MVSSPLKEPFRVSGIPSRRSSMSTAFSPATGRTTEEKRLANSHSAPPRPLMTTFGSGILKSGSWLVTRTLRETTCPGRMRPSETKAGV
jgi:hypothetical protein